MASSRGPLKPFPSGPIDIVVLTPIINAEGLPFLGPTSQQVMLVPTNYSNPQGLQGEHYVTFKSHKEWFCEDHGAKGCPTECFKSFNLPQDLKNYEKCSITSIASEYMVAQGVVNSLGIHLVKMVKNLSKDAHNLKKKYDHLVERDAF